MIGVIGSEDSVALVRRVADEMRLPETLVARAYRQPEEAPAHATELDGVCRVILFTGRVPHALVHARTTLSASTDYIPHSGVDLYRLLVMLMREYRGALPTVSIDTIDRAVVTENFEDIDERPPDHVFDLEPLLTEGASGTTDIADFHRRLHAAGEVELCITCLSSVRDALTEAGVPVARVAHTQGAVRDSLHRARLTSRVQRLEASQVASLTLSSSGDDPRRTAEIEAAFAEVVRAVGADSVDRSGGVPVAVATRGAVERATTALAPVLERLAALGSWLAVGYGDAAADALDQARYAATVARAAKDHQVVAADGAARRLVDGSDTGVRIRDTDPGVQAVAQLGGVGPMTLARLQAALADLGRTDVTAKELARAYGVEPRSARRLLTALAKAGLAAPLGAHSAPRAGRPQLIYRINLDALLRADAHADTADAEAADGGSAQA